MFDFEKFLEDEFLGFGIPKKIAYNTARTKDLMPACWKPIKDEKGITTGYKAICRTVGIAPEDVKVTVDDSDNIIVKGETEYEGEKYTQYFEIGTVHDIMCNIEKIDYKTLNGLTYIYLTVKVPESKKIEINKI